MHSAVSRQQPDLCYSSDKALDSLQVLVPERVGDKLQLPSHASLKGTAKKYTLDACLDGSVSQVCLCRIALRDKDPDIGPVRLWPK